MNRVELSRQLGDVLIRELREKGFVVIAMDELRDLQETAKHARDLTESDLESRRSADFIAMGRQRDVALRLVGEMYTALGQILPRLTTLEVALRGEEVGSDEHATV